VTSLRAGPAFKPVLNRQHETKVQKACGSGGMRFIPEDVASLKNC
jgi:hypothetical protein